MESPTIWIIDNNIHIWFNSQLQADLVKDKSLEVESAPQQPREQLPENEIH